MEHSGSGQMTYFEILNANGTALENGVYNFDETSTPSPIKTFDYASYSTNWDEDKTDNDWIWITSGKITINRNVNQYEVTINCTDENGKSIIGYFKGTLSYYDYVAGLRSAVFGEK